MDMQRDYPKFTKLLARLCETIGKPMTDELTESWWKALRHCDFEDVAERVDRYIARADESTKFPRPAQMRDKNDVPRSAEELSRNPTRDYWRTQIVLTTAKAMGRDHVTLEPVVEEHRDTLGRAMLDLLNELDQQERRDGRTRGMHIGCERRCFEIAWAYPELHRA
jgi:hypothetical protein